MATGQRKSKQNRITFCDKHDDEQVAVYSLTHETCMCLNCAVTEHNQIADFLPISQAGNMMRSKGHSLMKEICLLSTNAKAIKRERTDIMQALKASEKSVRGSIRTIRQKLNRHLDYLEQRAFHKVQYFVEKCELSYNKDTTELQKLDTELRQMADRLAQVLKSGSDVEVIKTVVEGKNKVPDMKAETTKQDTAAVHKTLRFEVTPLLETLQNEVKMFGKVYLHTDNKNDQTFVVPEPDDDRRDFSMVRPNSDRPRDRNAPEVPVRRAAPMANRHSVNTYSPNNSR